MDNLNTIKKEIELAYSTNQPNSVVDMIAKFQAQKNFDCNLSTFSACVQFNINTLQAQSGYLGPWLASVMTSIPGLINLYTVFSHQDIKKMMLTKKYDQTAINDVGARLGWEKKSGETQLEQLQGIKQSTQNPNRPNQIGDSVTEYVRNQFPKATDKDLLKGVLEVNFQKLPTSVQWKLVGKQPSGLHAGIKPSDKEIDEFINKKVEQDQEIPSELNSDTLKEIKNLITSAKSVSRFS